MALLEWQNLLFLIPIALGALYLLVTALTGLGASSGADVHGDLGGDAASGIDHDFEASADSAAAEAGLDHDADTGHDLAHADAGHVLPAVLDFFGIGRVPLSILVMCYCFVWGVVGLASLTLLGADRVWVAIAIAAAAALLITRQIAYGLARVMPTFETHHTPQRELVGLRGRVLYRVTETSGVVRLRDERNTLREVACRVRSGEVALPADTPVVLLRYEPGARVFLVAPEPASAPQPGARSA
jgi:membrane protein implicated in regulation of membrane protease activity